MAVVAQEVAVEFFTQRIDQVPNPVSIFQRNKPMELFDIEPVSVGAAVPPLGRYQATAAGFTNLHSPIGKTTSWISRYLPMEPSWQR